MFYPRNCNARLILAVLVLPVLWISSHAANVTVFSFKVNVNSFSAPSSIKGFTTLFCTELGKRSGITIIERENLRDITSEIALGQSGILNESAVSVDSLQFSGVDYIIGGTITQVSSSRFRVDIAIREVRTAKIISEKITGDVEKYPEYAAKMLAYNASNQISGLNLFDNNGWCRSARPLIMSILGACVMASGGAVRYQAETYYEEYETLTGGSLDEIDRAFIKAQACATGGEIALGLGSVTVLIGATAGFSSRKARTFTRE